MGKNKLFLKLNENKLYQWCRISIKELGEIIPYH